MPQLGSDTIAEAITSFTHERLDGSDEEVARMIDAALVAARRHVGWHVSPVDSQELVLDGPDSRILWLPTRKLVELISLEEDGNVIDPDTVRISAGGPPGILERPVAIRKNNNGWWSCNYSAIALEMEHGYTEDEAADWIQAIVSMVDQMSLVPIGGLGFSSSGLKSKRVDDVSYTWDNSYSMTAENVIFSVEHLLCNYELPHVEFV